MRAVLLFIIAVTLMACGPRTGPLNADFEHKHEVQYTSLVTTERATVAGEVKVLDLKALPAGLRKRASTQGIVADPNDPLNPRKMKRVIYSTVEAARAYPSIEDEHRVLGKVSIKLRIRYTRFRADEEEIMAEEAALDQLAAETAQELAREHGGNAVVRIGSSMKPKGEWWRHPDRSRFCRGERKRCVNHVIKFEVLYVSQAPRVIPEAKQLLETTKTEGYRPLPPRPMRNGRMTLPVKRHHCYQLSVALDKDAELPPGENLLGALSLYSSYKRFPLEETFHRVRKVGYFGCAPTSGQHQVKLEAYSGYIATNRNKADPAALKGVIFSFEERRMKPKEATRHFCGQCTKTSRSCGRLSTCKPLQACLRRQAMPLSICRDYYR